MKKKIAVIFSVIILSLTCAAFVNAQSDTDTNSKQTKDRKAKIKKKPVPKMGDCRQSSGLAVVRVTFDKSGKITEAEIIRKSGCKDFDNNSLRAARAIKFEPQIENGEAVTVTKPVEYTFQRY